MWKTRPPFPAATPPAPQATAPATVAPAPALPDKQPSTDSGLRLPAVPATVLLIRCESGTGLSSQSFVLTGNLLHGSRVEREERTHTYLHQHPANVVLMDIRKLGDDGFRHVEQIRKTQPAGSLVLLTDKIELSQVVRAIRLGVKDVHMSPLDLHAVVASVIKFSGLSQHANEDEFRRAITPILRTFVVDGLGSPDAPGPELGETSAQPAQTELQDRLRRLEAKVVEAEAESHFLKEEIIKVTSEYDRVSKAQIDDHAIREKVFADKEYEIALQSQAIRSQSEEQSARLAREKQLLEDNLAQLRAERDALDRVYAELENDRASLQAEKSALDARLADEKANCERELQDARVTLLCERQSLNEEQETFHLQLSALAADHKKLSKEREALAAIKAECESQRATVEEQKHELARAQQQLKRQRDQLDYDARALKAAEALQANRESMVRQLQEQTSAAKAAVEKEQSAYGERIGLLQNDADQVQRAKQDHDAYLQRLNAQRVLLLEQTRALLKSLD